MHTAFLLGVLPWVLTIPTTSIEEVVSQVAKKSNTGNCCQGWPWARSVPAVNATSHEEVEPLWHVWWPPKVCTICQPYIRSHWKRWRRKRPGEKRVVLCVLLSGGSTRWNLGEEQNPTRVYSKARGLHQYPATFTHGSENQRPIGSYPETFHTASHCWWWNSCITGQDEKHNSFPITVIPVSNRDNGIMGMIYVVANLLQPTYLQVFPLAESYLIRSRFTILSPVYVLP